MSDYAFRIAKDGSDVYSANPYDYVLNSDYPLLKIKYQGDQDSAMVSSVTDGIKITHSLGYQPMHLIYYRVDTGKWVRVAGEQTLRLYPYVQMNSGDDNNIYIYGLSLANDFYFYLFADSM